MATKLKNLFPMARFAPAATEEQISQIEADLGSALPVQLRQLYLECDGFREPTGNAKYLLSLFEEDVVGSLPTVTRFWRYDWQKTAPEHWQVNFKPYVFFGYSSGDSVWGIRLAKPHDIIAYHHSMEDAFETVGTDILELYQRDYSNYGN